MFKPAELSHRVILIIHWGTEGHFYEIVTPSTPGAPRPQRQTASWALTRKVSITTEKWVRDVFQAMLCVGNCILCRALTDSQGRTLPVVWGAQGPLCTTSASQIHCRMGAAPPLGSALQLPPSSFTLPTNRSPSIPSSLGTPTRVHSLGKSTFD